MRILAGLVAFGMAVAVAPAANADSPPTLIDHGVMVVTGDGTVSPGLPSTEPNTYRFVGVATVVRTTGVTTWACWFTAFAIPNIPAGRGGGTAGCGPSRTLTCEVARAELHLTFVCLAVGGPAGEIVATFALTPINVNPTTRYTFTGVAEWTPLAISP